MKKIKYMSLLTALLCILSLGFIACGDDDSKDTAKPVITDTGITANPVDCQQYHLGDIIPFSYVFTDDTELGNFNIEIHSNHDHHSHSTSSTECEEEEEEEHHHAANPWVFNQDYGIPSGLRSYTAHFDINIPTDITPGDYHFMIRLTDRAGWQQLKAIAIKVIE